MPPDPGRPTARAWWQPVLVGAPLAIVFAYAAWAVFQGTDYYVAPYLSPLYSPCFDLRCLAPEASASGGVWHVIPYAVWIPAGLRFGCYYYRFALGRNWWLSPPACAHPEPHARHGAPAWPIAWLQRAHRHFFYLSLPLLAVLWIDTARSFAFDGRPGIGVGSAILLLNVVLLSLYLGSCHVCRHLGAPGPRGFGGDTWRYRFWRRVTALNRHHGLFAWTSLLSVMGADLYIRLLSSGWIADPRLVL